MYQSALMPLTTAFTSSTERTTKAVPPAASILRMVASCSLVGFPTSVLTSNPQKRPLMQAMMSGMPAVPYIPPCSFHQKHRGTLFKYFMIDLTISDSFMCPKLLSGSLGRTLMPVSWSVGRKRLTLSVRQKHRYFKGFDALDTKNPISSHSLSEKR